ncbi:CCA tRNA nucleotidyltransferase [Cumulibacter manganitolerans]|uniref:CCA tRNA nucleotidyltransferase n=1 Tax=Cumulibacter manganitolerans TaxID=1884992 RepID=UPI00129619AF|nr:CCA tRNA nucleotidyltransferase [Cumulibacter manganitolerans]
MTIPEQTAQLVAVLQPVLGPLVTRFRDAGHELALVGGPVRDAVLGILDLRRSTDLDMTTSAHPQQVLELIEGYAEAVWTTGIEFGTVALTHRGFQIEITTYRADRYDRISRNPEVAFGDSITEDLARRDFTVNAMAVSLLDGTFHDPYDGAGDLRRRLLRTPAAPEESFADDPLRIFRLVRFIAQLGFAADPATAAAAARMSGELSRITAERLQGELTKLLLTARPRPGLEAMVELGIADVVLPELAALRMEIDEHHQHKDVYTHSLTVLDQAIDLEPRLGLPGPDLVIRLAALLHDVGKPATRRHEPAGGVSFHHHEVVGAKLVRKRLRALRYSKQIVEDVGNLTFLHLRFHGFSDGQWTDSAVRRYVTDAGDLLPRLHVLVRSDSTTRNKRRAARLSASYDALEARIEHLRQAEDLAAVRPDIDGNEIMRILGLPPGPTVGRAWKFLKELRLDRGPLDHDEAVAELRAWAAREGL